MKAPRPTIKTLWKRINLKFLFLYGALTVPFNITMGILTHNWIFAPLVFINGGMALAEYKPFVGWLATKLQKTKGYTTKKKYYELLNEDTYSILMHNQLNDDYIIFDVSTSELLTEFYKHLPLVTQFDFKLMRAGYITSEIENRYSQRHFVVNFTNVIRNNYFGLDIGTSHFMKNYDFDKGKGKGKK